MDYLRLYETEVISDEGLSFKAVSIPIHKLTDMSPEDIISELGLKAIDKVESGFYLRAVVTAIVAENESDLSEWRSFKDSALNEKLKKNNKLYVYALAEYVTMSRIIAFENSPLTGESIGNILTSGSAIGAYIGFVIAGQTPTPLLLITVPAGMIICGAASGIAKALEKGLKEKIITLLKKKEK